MTAIQLVVLTAFVLLLGCICRWWLLYRKFGGRDPAAHPQYREYQLLTGLIALLTLLVTLLIVFATDPGSSDDHQGWP